MKLTLSVIKADIGSIGGHIKPSQSLTDSTVVQVRVTYRQGRVDGTTQISLDETRSQETKRTGAKMIEEKCGRQNRRVLIIHGSNEVVKAKVKDFLQERLSLTPVILAEQPDEGLTIIDKFEKYVRRCSFAIAILTKDDSMSDGRARARQNVIYELGRFHGVWGCENMVLLKQKGVEMPSDLSGVVYKEFEGNKIESCFEEIRCQLEMAGLLPNHTPHVEEEG